MLIVRAPLRITLGGGGTDILSYYSMYGGFTVTAAIDKYIYIIADDRFDPEFRISYSKTEIVDKAENVSHPIFREALQLLGPLHSLELISIAYLPAKTGLGSSGTFTVALLNALHAIKNERIPPSVLAEEACDIIMNKLKEPSGKQDEYTAAYGGINSYTITMDGAVNVNPLKISRTTASEMETQLLLFYTGITRESKLVLESQSKAAAEKKPITIDYYHKIKQIGLDSRQALENGDIKQFGVLLNDHWHAKKALAPNATTPEIDAIYNLAMKNGATGGKIMGAGGGGFFMFHCDSDRTKLTETLRKHGLRRLDFRFEYEGSKIIIDL